MGDFYTPPTPIDHIGHGHKPPLPPAGGAMTGMAAADVPITGRGCGGATGTDLRDCHRLHGVYLADQRIHRGGRGLPTFDGGLGMYVRDWGRVDLPWLLLAINTGVLLVSSLTMEWRRRKGRRCRRPWLREVDSWNLAGKREINFRGWGLRFCWGSVFLAGQWLAWGELHARGFFVDTNPNSSFVFLLTIAHAVAPLRGE